MSDTVLVVEDDDGIALPLLRTLEREGYTVERLAEGLAAVERVAAGGVDLVMLDLGLPDVDGLDVCQRVRAEGYDGALIILTARGGELDRVVGLDVGADDYLPKPFALSELLARVRALLRRQAAARRSWRRRGQPVSARPGPPAPIAGRPRRRRAPSRRRPPTSPGAPPSSSRRPPCASTPARAAPGPTAPRSR